MTPSEIGAEAELEVAAALARAGKYVYLPFFAPHSRVDLVFADDRGIHRVQCKTSRVTGGVLVFRTCSNTKNVPKAYAGEIDYFGVWSPELRQAFLVPVSDAPTRLGSLRISPTINAQRKLIRWASDYSL